MYICAVIMFKMIKAVIIDDERKAREYLTNLIKNNFPLIEVIGQAESVESGKQLISETKPELLFLDVQMQDGTGFDLLAAIDRSNLQVIFVSAYDHFAITAIKFSAIDFLVKPVDTIELQRAIDKVKSQNSLVEVKQKLDLLLSNLNHIDKIALTSINGIEFVKIENIIRCEADSNYTIFYLTGAKKIMVSKSLKEFEEILSTKGFFRIHKSAIINLSFLKKYIKGDGGTVILEDGSELQVSRRRKEDFLEIISG